MQPIRSLGYSVYFNKNGYDALDSYLAAANYSSVFIIVDSNTNEYCLPDFLSSISTEITVEIIEIEPGESMKSVTSCVELWNILTEYGADRKSLVINLGGGVITDLGGFVASTYKRGIDYINVPTTLLGMVDAAIGGKNGIDLGHLKNQVGTITTPKMVLVDRMFLETLPQNELRSGLAEMLKHGLIADKGYWEKFLDLSQLDISDFDSLIYGSVLIKNEIVTQDLTENGIRKALNFGHTLGHAIESHFMDKGEPMLHGEAIAAGMVMESFIAMKKGLVSDAEFSQIKSTIKNTFEDIAFTDSDINSILSLLVHDEKNEYGQILFALIDGIGKAAINQDTENETIIEAFGNYKI